jgi:hypothetical protein
MRYKSHFPQVSRQNGDNSAGTQLVTRLRSAALASRSLVLLNWGFRGVERTAFAYRIGGTSRRGREETPQELMLPGVSWAVLTLRVELRLRAPRCDGLGLFFYRW